MIRWTDLGASASIPTTSGQNAHPGNAGANTGAGREAGAAGGEAER